MIQYVITAILTGILFGIMDGIINANPLAKKLLECYNPLLKHSINIPAGIIIDLIYGFVISGLFLFLLPIFPSNSKIIQGILFGTGIWFFRVLMNVISSWMMLNIPSKTLIYQLITGLFEMTFLGILNSLILNR